MSDVIRIRDNERGMGYSHLDIDLCGQLLHFVCVENAHAESERRAPERPRYGCRSEHLL